jgi:hypothetical protein
MVVRSDLIQQIKSKYCDKCPLHVNKMKKAQLENVLRTGGHGGQKRLNPATRPKHAFQPKKAPKIKSNQYIKDIEGKRKIIKKTKAAGEIVARHFRLKPGKKTVPKKTAPAKKAEKAEKAEKDFGGIPSDNQQLDFYIPWDGITLPTITHQKKKYVKIPKNNHQFAWNKNKGLLGGVNSKMVKGTKSKILKFMF